MHRREALPPDTVRGRRTDISNFELELRVMGEKSIREMPGMRRIAVASRQQRRLRRPTAPASGLRDRKAPKQTCAMRTGSFHRTISPLSIRDARPPAHTTSQSKQRLDGYARVGSVVKSPDLAVAIRATFSGHQE
ncbi:hypothetical protein [Candidatus Binatus sp.]|uniref:hypothetical protein n=1 Tax=Candidatus Binatus sp. TaxID=2811406 RepID=UPI003C3E57E1